MTQREYKAFLLRLWRERQDAPWHAALENANIGAKVGFATLQELVAYLEETTGESLIVTDDEAQSAASKHEGK